MDYSFSYYRGRYVYDTKDYLSAIRAGFFNVIYDPKNRNKMLDEIERLIDFYSSVDLYALAKLLYDKGKEDSLSRAYCIIDMLVSWDYVPAKYILGQMHFYGAGISKDLNRFFELSLEAANANFIPAKNALALAYFNGYGCKVDYAKGRQLLDECVKSYYSWGYYNIGIGYFNGSYGYPKDVYKAFEYFKSAAEQFHVNATYNLALMYLNGNGCSKNVEKGLSELVNAAHLGHVTSQKKLGDYYYFGKITAKNLDKAYDYYLMAAENGDAYSMYSVGYMIVNKEKAWVDRYVGIDWLRKAAYLGYESAQELLNKL